MNPGKESLSRRQLLKLMGTSAAGIALAACAAPGAAPQAGGEGAEPGMEAVVIKFDAAGFTPAKYTGQQLEEGETERVAFDVVANAYMEERHAEILQFARLQGVADSDLPEGEFDEEWAGFEEQLLIQRNENWLRHILAIRGETAVIAVGAGHLGGEDGLLNRLQQEGYTLERAEF